MGKGGAENCALCKGSGNIQITRCPKLEMASCFLGIAEFIEYAEEAHKHVWPESGGLNDQTQSFRDANRYYWQQMEMAREEARGK